MTELPRLSLSTLSLIETIDDLCLGPVYGKEGYRCFNPQHHRREAVREKQREPSVYLSYSTISYREPCPNLWKVFTIKPWRSLLLSTLYIYQHI